MDFNTSPERVKLKIINYFKPYSEKIILKFSSSSPSLIKCKMTDTNRLIFLISEQLLSAKKKVEDFEAKLLNYAVGIYKKIQTEEFVKEKLEEIISYDLTVMKASDVEISNDLYAIWLNIRKDFFPERDDLDNYKLVWSGRSQNRSLASCNVSSKTVRVARAMSQSEALNYLQPLLYHEMCHAYLGQPKVVKGRRIMHGRDFKELEKKHPDIGKLNQWIKMGGWDRAVKTSKICNSYQ